MTNCNAAIVEASHSRGAVTICRLVELTVPVRTTRIHDKKHQFSLKGVIVDGRISKSKPYHQQVLAVHNLGLLPGMVWYLGGNHSSRGLEMPEVLCLSDGTFFIDKGVTGRFSYEESRLSSVVAQAVALMRDSNVQAEYQRIRIRAQHQQGVDR